jgi:hypothetical protein
MNNGKIVDIRTILIVIGSFLFISFLTVDSIGASETCPLKGEKGYESCEDWVNQQTNWINSQDCESYFGMPCQLNDEQCAGGPTNISTTSCDSHYGIPGKEIQFPWGRKVTEQSGQCCMSVYELLVTEDRSRDFMIPESGMLVEYPVMKVGICQTDVVCHEDYSTTSVALYLDPEYIEKTVKERLFRPKEPFTPFDDIICEARVSGNIDVKADLKGELVSPTKKLISGDLKYVKTEENGEKVYQWKIQGWPNGWTPDGELMKTIIKEQKVGCKVTVNNKTEESGFSEVGLCVRLWGKDEASFAFVNTMTESAKKSPQWLVKIGMEVKDSGFHKIDPFDTYKIKFNHSVDLAEQNDKDWALAKTTNNYASEVLENLGLKLAESSYCKQAGLYFIYTDKGVGFDGGYHAPGANTVIIKSSIQDKHPELADRLPVLVVHETGHYFGLDDEYVYTLIAPKMKRTNCSTSLPPDFLPFGRIYFGCSTPTGFGIRSSKNSIMRSTKTENRFNVWSCAYLLEKIVGEGKSVKEYAQFAKDNLKCIFEDPRPKDSKADCMASTDCFGKYGYEPVCSECSSYELKAGDKITDEESLKQAFYENNPESHICKILIDKNCYTGGYSIIDGKIIIKEGTGEWGKCNNKGQCVK